MRPNGGDVGPDPQESENSDAGRFTADKPAAHGQSEVIRAINAAKSRGIPQRKMDSVGGKVDEGTKCVAKWGFVG